MILMIKWKKIMLGLIKNNLLMIRSNLKSATIMIIALLTFSISKNNNFSFFQLLLVLYYLYQHLE